MDKAKILNGPVSIVGYNGEIEAFRFGGLKKDVLSLSTEDIAEELEDYSSDLVGRKLTAEFVTGEYDPADLSEVKDSVDKIEFEIHGKSKKITVTKPATIADGMAWMVRPKIDGGKAKISVTKMVLGDAWPFAVGALS